eukprot:9673934-Lingulodinium_polyedra.AAC.1
MPLLRRGLLRRSAASAMLRRARRPRPCSASIAGPLAGRPPRVAGSGAGTRSPLASSARRAGVS